MSGPSPASTPAAATARAVVRTLAAAFLAIAALFLVVAGVGLAASGLLRDSTRNLAEFESATRLAVDRIRDGQSALRMALVGLLGGGSEGAALRLELASDRAESEVEAALDSLLHPAIEPQRERYRTAFREFTDEARRAVRDRDPNSDDIRRLFERHEGAMTALRELVAAENRVSVEAQRGVVARAERLRRFALALVAMGLAAVGGAGYWSARSLVRLMSEQAEQADQLSRVSLRLLERQESAARRFSHELHDELGQTLTAIEANVSALKADSPEFAERRADCLQLSEQAIANVREMSQLLHPTILDHLGLAGALRWLAEGFERRTGIAVSVECPFEGRLPFDTRAQLFRIAQEALTNVSRHADATRVEIELREEGDAVALRITDNGKGFAADSATARGLGLLGMRTRAGLAGGELTVKSSAGAGTTIEARAPRGLEDDGASDSGAVG